MVRTEPELQQKELSAADENDSEQAQVPPPAKRKAPSALAELLGNSYGNTMREPSSPEKSPFDIADEMVKKYREAGALTLDETKIHWTGGKNIVLSTLSWSS